MAHLAEKLRFFANLSGCVFYAFIDLRDIRLPLEQQGPPVSETAWLWASSQTWTLCQTLPWSQPTAFREGSSVSIFWVVLLLSGFAPQTSMHLLEVFWFLSVRSGWPCILCHLICVHLPGFCPASSPDSCSLSLPQFWVCVLHSPLNPLNPASSACDFLSLCQQQLTLRWNASFATHKRALFFISAISSASHRLVVKHRGVRW